MSDQPCKIGGMNESITFYLASGERHPDEETLQQSAFSQLLSEQLQKHDKAFGKDRRVKFVFPADGECGILELWVSQKVTKQKSWCARDRAKVSIDAFRRPILPEEFRAMIVRWIDEEAEDVILTRDVWGAEE